MAYYQIKNITDQLAKRHPKANMTLTIKLEGNFADHDVQLSPESTYLLEANFLPISIHKLRTEGVITVDEIDKNAFIKVVGELDKAKFILDNNIQLPDNKDVEDEKSRKKKFVK